METVLIVVASNLASFAAGVLLSKSILKSAAEVVSGGKAEVAKLEARVAALEKAAKAEVAKV